MKKYKKLIAMLMSLVLAVMILPMPGDAVIAKDALPKQTTATDGKRQAGPENPETAKAVKENDVDRDKQTENLKEKGAGTGEAVKAKGNAVAKQRTAEQTPDTEKQADVPSEATRKEEVRKEERTRKQGTKAKDDKTETGREEKPETVAVRKTPADHYAALKHLTLEERQAYVDRLTREEDEALYEYAKAHQMKEELHTVTYTNAAAPRGGIYIPRKTRKMRSGPTTRTDDGLVLDKTVRINEDGTYTLRLESYTTGTVTSTETMIPTDIVLVLDQSGSMAYDFNHNITSNPVESRQYALKNAVRNFIDSVAGKYGADSDHRLSIVTFGTEAEILRGWTFVDTDGKNLLKSDIDDLPQNPAGATNISDGMIHGEQLMNSADNYTGPNRTRAKIVILFTDGLPTIGTRFNTMVANGALQASKRMKDAGVTVYSIGILEGADPNQLYGPDCTGEIGSYWGQTLYEWETPDYYLLDRPAGNRFLNYVSNNFMKATDIGLREISRGFGWNKHLYAWRITANAHRNAAGFYLTADNAQGLNDIFETISGYITTPTIQLGSEAVVKDKVTEYFDMPEDPGTIRVMTADKTETGWGPDEPSDLEPTVDGRSVHVTGFDYNQNFISDDPRDGFYGKKLIIEFEITRRPGFLGGNNVPTNEATTAIHPDGNKPALKYFPVPRVNLPIPDVTIRTTPKNMYLLQIPSTAELMVDGEAKAGTIDLLQPLEPWQEAYVEVGPLIVFNDGFNGTEDGTFAAKMTLTPLQTGDGAVGEPVVAKTGEATPKDLLVYKPELTNRDKDVFYGGTVPTDFTDNPVRTKWKHGTTYDTEVAMIGTAPQLKFTCTPDADMTAGGRINGKEDIPVAMKVKIRTRDVTGYTTFVHQDCAGGCTFEGEPTTDKAFVLHVKTGTLTLKKVGGAPDEPYIFYIYKDGEKYTDATLKADGTVVIKELPQGTYSVQEDEAWSWRWNPVIGEAVALNMEHPEGQITCTNTRNDNDEWLNDYSEVIANTRTR